MASQPFGQLILDPSLPAFSPDRCDPEMEYWALRCPCGHAAFRASGWPRVVGDEGSYFWRTLTRVWREARLPMHDGEPAESPFAFPLTLKCARCAREDEIFSDEGFGSSGAGSAESRPREAYRCRACRRAVVELVVGVTNSEPLRAAAEVVARCRACQREARIAWYDARPSSQELRLDHLYGRR